METNNYQRRTKTRRIVRTGPRQNRNKQTKQYLKDAEHTIENANKTKQRKAAAEDKQQKRIRTMPRRRERQQSHHEDKQQ